MAESKPLEASALLRRCDPTRLGFSTTDELQGGDEPLGQERATEALRFAVEMARDGYNAFALGPPGHGKHELVRRLLEQRAQGQPVPPDWCHVHSFAEPHRPRALKLPAGRGGALKRDMEALIQELRGILPAAFESEDYRTRRKLLEQQLKERSERAFSELERKAESAGVALLRTPVGLAFAPARGGEVVEAEEFERLPKEEQERFRQAMKDLQEQLRETLAALPAWEREHRERLKALEREVTSHVVDHLIGELKERWADVEAVVTHLTAVQADLLEHADDFLPRSGGASEGLLALAGPRAAPASSRPLRRYEVNLLVDHSQTRGAPVVFEDSPTLPNLIGRVEHLAEMGTLVTDFLLIKAGALQRASGGYLVLDARKLLMQALSWEQLKRALRSRQVRIESLGEALALVSTVTLEPEPIPLSVKVVLLGDRMLYYLLAEWDPDFQDLFKVAADFEERVERSESAEQAYARYLAALARREATLPLDAAAVARAIEHAARLAGDAQRLTTHVGGLTDLLQEADHAARGAGRGTITAADVQQAIGAQVRRADRLRERYQEEIGRGTILIDTAGAQVGQVNGLSVIQLGGFAFGRPSRITARVRLGTGGVVDIEREVALGGPIHSKGVLILAGYLGARYSAERPLSVHATLVFEQSYSGVEGDSASTAELLALLSALASVPLRQDLAITGSVNQLGQIQPIGGVNEKVEGFFDVCQARGLRGTEGVVIPAANVKDLMLREDVVQAAAEGRFRVYAVARVDEALELLTGHEVGERDAGGAFPEGSVNRLVEARLERLAERARDFARAGGEPPKPA